MLTQKRLKELLHYDPETGIFVWRKKPNKRVNKGDTAGHCHLHGYVAIGIGGILYSAHRLVWLYEYGYFPERDIDHIDRNKSNNSSINLREVSRTCNVRNTGNRKNNTSGVKGVAFSRFHGKWLSFIYIPGKRIHLGFYISLEEAVCHRLAAEQAEGWENCDYSSPASQYVKKHIQKT